MHTAVLIHGLHLQADDWENVIWGDPQNNIIGRAAKGIIEAVKWRAETIIFSTGASERNGLKEGEYIYRYAFERVGELSGLTDMHVASLQAILHGRHVLELTSQDTRSEVLASAKIAKERGAKRLVLVSSPTHIERCHRDAISVLGNEPQLRFFLENLYTTTSDTCYAASTVDDVIIVEPPHRGDMPKVPFHKTVKRIFKFLKNPDAAFALNDALWQVIDEHEKAL